MKYISRRHWIWKLSFKFISSVIFFRWHVCRAGLRPRNTTPSWTFPSTSPPRSCAREKLRQQHAPIRQRRGEGVQQKIPRAEEISQHQNQTALDYTVLLQASFWPPLCSHVDTILSFIILSVRFFSFQTAWKNLSRSRNWRTQNVSFATIAKTNRELLKNSGYGDFQT